jgi:hypothetical protein
MSLFTDASRVTAIGAQLTLSESRLSDGFAPIPDLPAGAPEQKASTQAAIRRAREIGRP